MTDGSQEGDSRPGRVRWATAAEFGKILYVGEDFIEFLCLNPDTMEYGDKILINSQLILEVMVSGYEVSRLIAELSANAVTTDTDN